MTETPPVALPKVHVFTGIDPPLFLKQFPGFSPRFQGFDFTFGMDVPDDIDVLIVHTRASYSIPTTLPRERTVFFAGEPDVIHPYSASFLNQFGLVLSTTSKELETEHIRSAFCQFWYAGFDMTKPRTKEHLLGYDWFAQLKPPEKIDKLSIVMSGKTHTLYHRKRRKFLADLIELIPERIELYGHGTRSIGDKKDALLPYSYHLAIENGEGNDVWTEKLSDPLLCWSFPFYSGCTNVDNYFPSDSYHYLDLDNPQRCASEIVRMMDENRYKQVIRSIESARMKILKDYNISWILARLAHISYSKPIRPTARKQRLIRSERSIWPEKNRRGGYIEWAIRNAILLVDQRGELRFSRLQRQLEMRRANRRYLKNYATKKSEENQTKS